MHLLSSGRTMSRGISGILRQWNPRDTWGLSYRTHREEVVHLSRVEEVEDLNLVEDDSSRGNERRAAHAPVGVPGLEEETSKLSFPHGQQTDLQSGQRHVWVNVWKSFDYLHPRRKTSAEPALRMTDLSLTSSSGGTLSAWWSQKVGPNIPGNPSNGLWKNENKERLRQDKKNYQESGVRNF